MDNDDAQTWRDIRYFTSRLLFHAGVLPADLVAMLQEYESELDNASPTRWVGMGSAAQHEQLARKIGQWITDGEWQPGACLDLSLDKRYWAQAPENVTSALRFLAVRGEIILRGGKYYVRSCNENS